MTIRDEVIAVLEEAFEELEEIRDFKLGPYHMDPDFPDPDKAREFGLTVEEMTGIDDIMIDVDAVYNKLEDLLEQMNKDDKNIPSEEENPRVKAFRKLAEATAPKKIPLPKKW